MVCKQYFVCNIVNPFSTVTWQIYPKNQTLVGKGMSVFSKFRQIPVGLRNSSISNVFITGCIGLKHTHGLYGNKEQWYLQGCINVSTSTTLLAAYHVTATVLQVASMHCRTFDCIHTLQ